MRSFEGRLWSGEIRETELVAKWHRLYSGLMRWIEEEEPLPKPRELSEKEAAESGLFFAWFVSLSHGYLVKWAGFDGRPLQRHCLG